MATLRNRCTEEVEQVVVEMQGKRNRRAKRSVESEE